MPGNEEIWHLFTLTQTQWRVGAEGLPFGLDYGTIMEIARALEIETGIIFFEKLRVFEIEVLKIWNNKGEKGICDERQKAKCRFEFGDFFEWACKNCEKSGR